MSQTDRPEEGETPKGGLATGSQSPVLSGGQTDLAPSTPDTPRMSGDPYAYFRGWTPVKSTEDRSWAVAQWQRPQPASEPPTRPEKQMKPGCRCSHQLKCPRHRVCFCQCRHMTHYMTSP